MASIPQDVIDRVRAAHDIVDVVGRSLPLKKVGRAWKALCPFHDENTPSFQVNAELQIFKCFGCGKGGNVFQWLVEREKLKFFEAVRLLAAEKGIPVPDSGGRGGGGVDRSMAAAIREAFALAQDLFVRTLWGPDGTAARAYLEKRGYPPPAVKAFGLGLAPDAWDGLLAAGKAKGLTSEVLEAAGLVKPREKGDGSYDRFRARLMFPVADLSGRIVTYGARALREGDEPKYLNGPETSVFKKGRTVYGLDRARDGIKKAGHAIVMEGYTDVLMAHLHGFTSAVACMGTAFTPEQARLLSQFTSKVVLLYDGDEAGRAAAEKNLDGLLEQGLEVRVALLPEGKDVDEVLLEDGVEALDAIVRGAGDFFDFLVARLSATVDLSSERGKAQAAERLAESLLRVKSPIERDLLFPRIAQRLGVREVLVRQAAQRRVTAGRHAALRTQDGSSRAESPADPLDEQARKRDLDLRLAQERFVAAAVFAPQHLTAIREIVPPEEIADPGLRTIYDAALSLLGTGLSPTPEAVARAVSDDSVAAAALAGLPGDVEFDDWVPQALRERRTALALETRRRAVLQGLTDLTAPPQDVRPRGGS